MVHSASTDRQTEHCIGGLSCQLPLWQGSQEAVQRAVVQEGTQNSNVSLKAATLKQREEGILMSCDVSPAGVRMPRLVISAVTAVADTDLEQSSQH